MLMINLFCHKLYTVFEHLSPLFCPTLFQQSVYGVSPKKYNLAEHYFLSFSGKQEPKPKPQKKSLSAATIAGIAIALIVIVICVIDFCCCFWKKQGLIYCCFSKSCGRSEKGKCKFLVLFIFSCSFVLLACRHLSKVSMPYNACDSNSHVTKMSLTHHEFKASFPGRIYLVNFVQ